MNKLRMKWSCLFLLIVGSSLMGATETWVEIRGGDKVAVVTAEDAPETVALAAKDLQRVLKDSLAVDVQAMHAVPDSSDYAAIFSIGGGVAPEGIEVEELGDEEYWIYVGDKTIFLGGNDSPGNPLAPYFPVTTPSYYAVAQFLRDELGVRWLFPGPLGEVIPQQEKISIAQRSERLSPSYPIRTTHYAFSHIYGGGERNALVLWGRRNGMGTAYSGSSGHADSQVVGQRYFETHPEYYALINGERTNLGKYGKLCHSNPDLPQLWVQYALQSDLKSVSTSANDGRGWCECEACIELDGPNRIRANGTPITSGRVFTFTNRVARALQDAGIDKQVFVYAYADYAEPPETVEKMEPNVILFLARDLKTVARSETNRQLLYEQIKEWDKLASGIAIRDYRGVYSPTVVNPVPHIYARELAYLGQFDWFKGISTNGDDSRDWALTGPAKYVAAHLMWDASEDYETLLDEWYRSGWPESHQHIRAYYELFQQALDDYFASGKGDSLRYLSVEMQDVASVYTQELLDLAEQQLNLAEQAAITAEEKARIEFVRVGLEATRVERDYMQAAGALAESGVPLPRYTAAVTESVTTAERQRRIKAATEASARRLAFHQEHIDSMAIPSKPLLEDTKYAGQWVPMFERLYEMEVDAGEGVIAIADPWLFQLDPQEKGEEQGWATRDYDDSGWDLINTNDFWENQGYGIDTDPQGRPDGYNGIAWYRREVEVPSLFENQSTVFFIGAVDESFVMYVDGQEVAAHTYDGAVDPDSWRKPHRIDISDYCRPGERVQIAIRVQDLRGVGGIWQPCYLEISAPKLLDSAQSNRLETWSISPQTTQGEMETDPDENAYLQIDTHAVDALPARLVTRISQVKPNRVYRIQGFFKAIEWDGVRNNRRQLNPFGLRITYFNNDRKTIDTENAAFFYTSPPDGPWTPDNWVYFSETVHVPDYADIVGMNLTIWVRYNGIFAVRDVSIEQISVDE